MFCCHHFLSEPPKVMPLSFGADILNEGAFAQVSCIVAEGDEPLSISWSFHGSDITSDLGIVTSQVGTRMTMLVISSVGHRHRGNYTCIAQNSAGTVSQTVELKVNGKFLLIEKALELDK
jgi:Immunoglobulin I-set domain